jgi:hypothetical protein
MWIQGLGKEGGGFRISGTGVQPLKRGTHGWGEGAKLRAGASPEKFQNVFSWPLGIRTLEHVGFKTSRAEHLLDTCMMFPLWDMIDDAFIVQAFCANFPGISSSQ